VINDDAAIELLVGLVSTPSVSGNEDAAVERFVRFASDHGLCAQIDDEGNAEVLFGSDNPEREIVLVGHIDTVPGDIPVRLEDGILHGRGSVDAKGPLCTFLVAASRAEIPDGVRVRVVGSLSEETDSHGARSLAHRIRPDACIIGEPSGWDGVTLGYKGCATVEFTIEADEAHSAGPDASACDEAHALWSRVFGLIKTLNTGHSRVFDTLQATLRGIESGGDGVRQHATMRAGFRLPRWINPHELESHLRRILNDDSTLEMSNAELAHATDRSDPVARALSGAIRSGGVRPHPKLKTGTSDTNIVGPVWGCPIVAYGPGDSSLDHTPGEHLHIREYLDSIGVLSAALGTLAVELISVREKICAVGA